MYEIPRDFREEDSREVSEFADGSVALDRAGLIGKLGPIYSTRRMEYVARAQNRAMYVKMIRQFFNGHYLNAMSYLFLLMQLVQYGAYAWLEEICRLCPIADLSIYAKSRLLLCAINIRDPVIVRLLLDNGAVVTKSIILMAINWLLDTNLHPSQKIEFASPEAERARLIQAQQEIVDLLSPFKDAFPGAICDEGLTVNPDQLLGMSNQAGITI